MTEYNPFLKELYENFKNNNIDTNELKLLAEVAVENNRLNILQEIFSFDKDNKHKIRDNKDIYKWGFMYGDENLHELLEKEMNYKCIQGAINAAISHDNYKGFLHLLRLYPEEVLTEKNFNNALTWNNQSRYSFNIMNEYIKNISKIRDLSIYSVEQIKSFNGYPRAPILNEQINTILLKKNIEEKLNSKNTKRIKTSIKNKKI